MSAIIFVFLFLGRGCLFYGPLFSFLVRFFRRPRVMREEEELPTLGIGHELQVLEVATHVHHVVLVVDAEALAHPSEDLWGVVLKCVCACLLSVCLVCA